MIQDAINKLKTIVDTYSSQLYDIDELVFNLKIDSNKWSKKEILGHLIDSATNNHQRFIRTQFEVEPTIWYEQNNWVEKSNYQNIDKIQLIYFWIAYNQHLIHIIEQIPSDKLSNICVMKDGTKLTLEFLINDYVTHLEYHLKQIVS